MLPNEIACLESSADSLHLRLQLAPTLFWFKGHFPGQPVLPGIAQIHWVQHYAREHLGLSGRFAGMQAIKFQSPAYPGQTLELRLQWLADKQLLKFSYACLDATASSRPVSSGKIRWEV
jgi:3-hydroxymyristoyl/3-hydroxydecanoyl-(acyl carrier protein) dehydratase